MSFLGNLFGGQPKQVAVQTTSSTPPSYALPYLKSSLKRAEDVYQTPQEYYPEQTWIDFAPATMAALDRGEARAMAGSPLVRGAQDFIGTTMGGGFLNPAAAMLQETARGDYLSGENPYLAAALQPAIDRVQGMYSRMGRLGSGANVAALTGALAPTYAQNYATERAHQLAAQRSIGDLAQTDLMNRYKAAAAAPGMAAEDYGDIGKLAAFGAAREQKTGEELADQMARFNFLQSREQESLANFLSSVRGGTMGSTQAQPIYGDPAGSAIGNLATLGQAAYYGSKLFG
jgi:hypothetical protein